MLPQPIAIKTWVKLGVFTILSLHATFLLHDVTMRQFIESNTHCHKLNGHEAVCHIHTPIIK